MICEIITASALILIPVDMKTRTNSVDHADKLIRLTERVLDRSICKDIERVQAPDKDLQARPDLSESQKQALREKAVYDGKRQATAHSLHCKASTRVVKDKKSECNLVK